MRFGYSTKTTARSDISSYLKQLKKDSKGSMDIILEGTDLMKLRSFPLDKIIGVKEKLVASETENFKQTLNRDFLHSSKY